MNIITVKLGDVILDKMTGKELVVYGFWAGIDPVANGVRYRRSGYGILWEKTGKSDLEEAKHQQRKYMKIDLDRWFDERDRKLPAEELIRLKIKYREQFLAESTWFDCDKTASSKEDPV